MKIGNQINVLLASRNRPVRSSSAPHTCLRHHSAGFALVFVLAMLVLILVVVLAFFSRTMLHRQIGMTTAAQVKVGILSETAADLVLDDFQHEIEAGSLPPIDPDAAHPVRRPRTLTQQMDGRAVMIAPSIIPQRVADNNALNVVKVSRASLPFFTSGPGYGTPAGRSASGPVRASAISTTTQSADRRSMKVEQWLRPRLLTASEETAFVAPDWIYLDRDGKTPTSFSAADLQKMASAKSGGGDFVIGRYAYVVYDLGGLIDINVVGNAQSADQNARRGRLHQVSLADAPGNLQTPDFADFVEWRSPLSSGQLTDEPGSNSPFDPKRGFVTVPPGEQAFVNRQDLLAYVESPDSAIPDAALSLLTTFSRDLDAPSYEPDSTRPLLPTTPDPNDMNPPLLSVVFPSDSDESRPDSDVKPIRKGSPVMPRRFPLTKLRLFEEENPDPEEMTYYFGLSRGASGDWNYTAATSAGYIKTLDEVAAERREPNFFEVLQAGIYSGSVAQNGSDTYTLEQIDDRIRELHTFQIGANIIDQWDEDDIPTTLTFPSGVPGAPFQVHGIENLPYISQIGLVGWRPADDRDLFQVWALFDVWNPHQNAETPPVGIDQFRIVPLGGSGRIILRYQAGTGYAGSTFVAIQSLIPLNAGRNFTFSPSRDYSEPVTLGSIPTSKSDTPGLLMIECSPPPVADLGATAGVKAYNAIRLRSIPQADAKHWQFALQARISETGTWRTYQL